MTTPQDIVEANAQQNLILPIWEDTLIIDQGISIDHVVTALNKSGVSNEIVNNPSQVFRSLGESLSRKRLSDLQDSTPAHVFSEIVNKFVTKHGNTATVGKLRTLFEENHYQRYSDCLTGTIKQLSLPPEPEVRISCSEVMRSTMFPSYQPLHMEKNGEKIRSCRVLFALALFMVIVVVTSIAVISIWPTINTRMAPGTTESMTQHPPKIIDCHIDCDMATPECDQMDQVDRIFWRGDLTVTKFDEIVSNASNVSEVYVESLPSCSSLDTPSKLRLATSSSEIRRLSRIQSHKLTAFHIKETKLGHEENEIVWDIINSNSPSLEAISLPVHTWNAWMMSKRSILLPNLLELSLDNGNNQDLAEISSNFCTEMPALQNFNATSSFISFTDVQKLMRCSRLASLEANLKVPKEVRSVKVMQHFKHKPSSLRSLKLYVVFELSTGAACSLNADFPPRIFREYSVLTNCATII